MSVLDSFSLKGKTAVVSGATRGLGRAFARALAEAGANIVVVGRDAVAAAEVEAEMASLAVGATTVLADVTQRDDVERMLAHTVAAFGRADVLVNNAGVCIHKPAVDVTDADWRAVMDVNLDGVWVMSQVFGSAHDRAGRRLDRERGLHVRVDRQPPAMAAGVQRLEGRRAPPDP